MHTGLLVLVHTKVHACACTCTGLDSASALEILKILRRLADSGRSIVITIHQPRSEIFHAFDKVLLLCNGHVAYFGSPLKVFQFFQASLEKGKKMKVSIIK